MIKHKVMKMRSVTHMMSMMKKVMNKMHEDAGNTLKFINLERTSCR